MTKSRQPVYITTTLPYANSAPHVGFAMELIRADVLARYFELAGHEVFFNTGTDEHGQKLFEAASKAGSTVQDFVDQKSQAFKDLIQALSISSSVHFIRTTDDHHKKAAQELWRRVRDAGYLYKKMYPTKYCVGCELEKTDSELEDGRCPVHPNEDLVITEEENYYFKFSEFTDQLLEYYQSEPVLPKWRQQEIASFIKQGLQDFSVSRLKDKMSWGVPVPDDDDHVMYVWFDALTNYISTLGWPEDADGLFNKFWQEGITYQIAGKDNLRQQSAMWQAMLMAIGISNTNHILIEGFFNSNGQKMSKSLGNVINPFDIVRHYGADALRFYVLRQAHNFEDSDITIEKIHEAYTAHLVNGIGNATSRIMALSERHCPLDTYQRDDFTVDIDPAVRSFDFNGAMDALWSRIGELDERIAREKPFALVKEDKEAAQKIIRELVQELGCIAVSLEPFLPDSSLDILETIEANKKPEAPLFKRKDLLVL